MEITAKIYANSKYTFYQPNNGLLASVYAQNKQKSLALVDY